MTNSRNTRLAAAGVLVVALSAAGAALAAGKLKGSNGAPRPLNATAVKSSARTTAPPFHFDGRRGPGRGDDLAAAATYLGISGSELATQLQSGKTLAQIAGSTSGKSTSGLIDALVAHEQAEAAQAVKDGRLTQSQADAMLANVKARVTAEVNGSGFPGPRPGGPRGFGFGPGGRGGGLAAAATYLGLSQSELRTQLQSGKTLGEIADATSGKSKSGLVDALVAAEKSQLSQAVKDGRLTQAQADALTANLQARVTAEVDGTFRGHDDGDGHGFGPGGPGGPGDRAPSPPTTTVPPTHI